MYSLLTLSPQWGLNPQLIPTCLFFLTQAGFPDVAFCCITLPENRSCYFSRANFWGQLLPTNLNDNHFWYSSVPGASLETHATRFLVILPWLRLWVDNQTIKWKFYPFYLLVKILWPFLQFWRPCPMGGGESNFWWKYETVTTNLEQNFSPVYPTVLLIYGMCFLLQISRNKANVLLEQEKYD